MNNAIRSRSVPINLSKAFGQAINQRGKAFGIMLFGALLAFEVFNYSTTDFALNDVLGNLTFMGIRWSTILSIAFCGIDFAGIARIFTPEQGADEPIEVWYLFGAWVLAAAMNATLTWWGVSVAIVNHTSQGAVVVGNETIRDVVPVFVAIMVWVIRILIIGSFSVAGERMFSQDRPRNTYRQSNVQRSQAQSQPAHRPTPVVRPAQTNNGYKYANNGYNASANNKPLITTANNIQSPQQRAAAQHPENKPTYSRAEPTYHNLTNQNNDNENYGA